MIRKPRVSVIMNCLNCARYLREALHSVYGQTYLDWEIIFWDNGSTDDSLQIAQQFGEKTRYFVGESTVPLGQARNLAIEKAEGEFLAFLDCDDMWLPEKLECQVHLLERRPDIDLVYGNFYYDDFFRGRSRKLGSSRQTMRLALKRRQPEGSIFEYQIRNYTIGLLTVLIRRRAMVGLDTMFDDSLQLAEEFDLFLRLLHNGQAAYLHQPLAVARVHAGMTSIRLKTRWYDEIQQVLRGLRRIDANGRYKAALEDLNVRSSLYLAKNEIALGRLRWARQHLAPHRWYNTQFAALYIVSFLPPRLWKLMRPLWGRRILLR